MVIPSAAQIKFCGHAGPYLTGRAGVAEDEEENEPGSKLDLAVQVPVSYQM